VVNLGYALNDDHEFGFNFIYNRNAERHRPADGRRAARESARSRRRPQRAALDGRDLQNFQMLGRHDFPDWLEMHADWLVSLAGTSQDEPDQRYFNYARDEDYTGNDINNNALPEPSVPTRNYRNLEESNLNARFDDSIKFRWLEDLETVFGVGTA
jgi:hypothetical protein